MKEIALILLLVGVATVCCRSLGNRDSRQLSSDCSFGCFAVYQPVCGSDGRTYGNECSLRISACLHHQTITVASQGPCGPQ